MHTDLSLLNQAANEARGLAIDAIAKSKSGHLGLPLGSAEIGAMLYGIALNVIPQDPHWLNRDRFVLSAGHGSMFLYSWLNIAGYDLPIEQLKQFRQVGSKTPGHPEFGETVGVEATTGPLGQGIGNGVGMAIAAKMAAARFNSDQFAVFNHKVVVLCGDGCMQEGVASEASAFAGRFGLDNLILIYDSNDVTLDGPSKNTQGEDTAERYRSYGWTVQIVKEGNDIKALHHAYEKAHKTTDGRPQLIIAKTLIGKGIKEIEGTAKAHGEGGVKFAASARKDLGLPEELFYVSPAVRAYFAKHAEAKKAAYDQWQAGFAAWKAANPDKAALLEKGVKNEVPENLLESIPSFPVDTTIATRKAGSVVLQSVAEVCPLLISGSADLHGSTLNYIGDRDKKPDEFDIGNFGGRNIFFGIREHAMGSMLNGIGYYGIFKASGATFLVFADYMRPAIRVAALAKLPVFYILTHDSIGVGEDGPTHQPVETVSGLRVIPNLDVIRPADPEECAGAYAAAVERKDGPTALILSRQNLPNLNDILIETRRNGVLKGGYVALKETGDLKLIIIASGSEVQWAFAAAKAIGNGVRVVSMPCMERFDRMDAAYRESVLPAAVTQRLAVEAGVTGLWYKYVGLQGKVIGTDRFGESAPGDIVMKHFGLTAENVTNVAKSLL